MKIKYLVAASMIAFFAACSDEAVNPGHSGTALSGEKGYVTLSINLPTEQGQGTRVADGESVDFNDGLPAEYEVNDASLLLFKGTSEADATFASAYNLDVTGFANQSPADDNITSKATIVREIVVPEMQDAESIYALVIVNGNGLLTISGNGAAVNGTQLTTTTKFSDFVSMAQTFDNGSAAITDKGFFMSNAPLYSVPGGTVAPDGGSVSTLAEIDKEKIYSTQSEAAEKPAANIYVERAVAKVTVTADDKSSGIANPDIASYTIEGWTLNVTNKKTYLVRNVSGADWWTYYSADATATDKYRFVGSTPVAAGLYRTYWGIDPNYSAYAADFDVKSGQEIAASALTEANGSTPLYCLENTFDIANMNENQTTAVVVKAKLTLADGIAETDGSFYVLNDNPSTLYKKEGVENEVKRRLVKWIDENKGSYIESGTIEGNKISVTLSNASTGEGGYLTVTGVKVTDESGITWKSGMSLTEFNAAIAQNLTDIIGSLAIGYYKEGETYYAIKLKHFGDTQTPWKADGGESYEGNGAEKWLGRYGVLRNNWYDVTVSGIRNIGYPSVPDVNETPDDPESTYIAVTINILSWAKRTQSVEL